VDNLATFGTWLTVGLSCLIATTAQANVDADLPRQADIMVLGIVLDHPESTKNAFGITLKPEDPDAIHPSMALCNHDKTEKLVVEFYERDTDNVVSELLVERVKSKHEDCVIPPQHIDNFDSGKGIHLGMTKAEVTRILGNTYREHPNPEEQIISYRLDDKDSPLLQRHNAPAYYGQYHFRNGKLVRFEVGFEFP
jgi:hypothetical protein